MSNIDKQALRQLATDAHELGIIKRYSKGLDAQRKFYAAATPLVIRALLDELEAAKQDSAKWFKAFEKAVSVGARYEERLAEQQRSLDHREFLLLSADQVQREYAEVLGCACDNESILEAIAGLKEQVRTVDLSNGVLNQRIAELEARTVTLPEPFKLAKSSSGLTYYYADEVDAAIHAAGIGKGA